MEDDPRYADAKAAVSFLQRLLYRRRRGPLSVIAMDSASAAAIKALSEHLDLTFSPAGISWRYKSKAASPTPEPQPLGGAAQLVTE
jgi:hypothetical protein